MATKYTPILLSGSEQFTHNGQPIGYSMEDFWRFQFSNIWEMQEEVAEFLVAKALGQAPGPGLHRGVCCRKVGPSCDGLLEIPVPFRSVLGAVLPHGDIGFENMP